MSMGTEHLRSRPAPIRRLELRADSDAAQIATVRKAVEQFAAEAGFDARARDEFGLCVNEALANVVRHAYGGAAGKPVVIVAEYLGDGTPTLQQHSGAMRVTIRDWGSGVNPEDLPPKPFDPLKPGGVGMICLRRLMDEVTYAPQPDGMLLTMVKRKSC